MVGSINSLESLGSLLIGASPELFGPTSGAADVEISVGMLESPSIPQLNCPQ